MAMSQKEFKLQWVLRWKKKVIHSDMHLVNFVCKPERMYYMQNMIAFWLGIFYDKFPGQHENLAFKRISDRTSAAVIVVIFLQFALLPVSDS